MILFRKPTETTLRHFLDAQARLELTYPDVGATARQPPSGYTVDHMRTRLGEGEKCFQAAKFALARWEHFSLGWTEAWSPDTPIREGKVVAVLARQLGLWWLNACRIVYVVDQEGPVTAFGFAYGTLPGHAASGEERFLVEWDRERGDVWFDILAFSRLRHPLARLGYPWARHVQKRFKREAGAAMQRATHRPGHIPQSG